MGVMYVYLRALAAVPYMGCIGGTNGRTMWSRGCARAKFPSTIAFLTVAKSVRDRQHTK